MSKDYRFVTNLRENEKMHVLAVANKMNLDYRLVNFEPGRYSFEINAEYPDIIVAKYFKNDLLLCRIIRQALIDSGYCTEEEAYSDKISGCLGCENDLYPEKAEIYRSYLESHFEEIYEKVKDKGFGCCKLSPV